MFEKFPSRKPKKIMGLITEMENMSGILQNAVHLGDIEWSKRHVPYVVPTGTANFFSAVPLRIFWCCMTYPKAHTQRLHLLSIFCCRPDTWMGALPGDSPWFTYWTWCSVVWNNPLVSLGHLSQLRPLHFFLVPSHWLRINMT